MRHRKKNTVVLPHASLLEYLPCPAIAASEHTTRSTAATTSEYAAGSAAIAASKHTTRSTAAPASEYAAGSAGRHAAVYIPGCREAKPGVGGMGVGAEWV